MRRARRSAVLTALAVSLVACASPASSSTQPSDQGRLIRIDMSEFAFTPPRIILAAGETVTLELSNIGSVEHEFMAGNGVMSGKGYHEDWLALTQAKGVTAHVADHSGTAIRVAPHTIAKLVLVVPPQIGQIEFGCFVEGHYEGGMHGVIVVAGVAGATTAPSSSAAAATPAPAMSGHAGEMDEEQH